MQNVGRAVDGPLAGIKITAGLSWDGKVEADIHGVYEWDGQTRVFRWRRLERPYARRPGRPSKNKSKSVRA